MQRQVELSDEMQLVFKAMEALPEKQRIVMQLRDIEQFEFQEISEMLDINETAIRVNLSRARKAVREELVKQYNYGIS